MGSAVASRGVVPAPGQTFERREPLRVALLGATGSIGRQTADVCRRHPDKVRLVAVAANSSAEALCALTNEFPTIERAALADESLRGSARLAQAREGCKVSVGREAVLALAHMDGVDCVVNALSGFAGMRASALALEAGLELALANKESLVAAGDLLMPLARPGKLLPVDSEHSAIFQCMLGEDPARARLIWLTASGGPFFGRTRAELTDVTAEQALHHPNWHMGPRITVDSATMMNKGLEVIEAHHLFQMPYEQIRVVVQRQSAVHSMVEFDDGTVKAHLGAADMRVPIQYALSFPDRWAAPCEPTCWPELGHVDFADPDTETFGCLRLALAAGARGGVAPCAMNAADEVAVAAFLAGRIRFLDIEAVVGGVLEALPDTPAESLEQLEDVDAWARAKASELVRARA